MLGCMLKSARKIAILGVGAALFCLWLSPLARADENGAAMTEKQGKPAIVDALEKATEGLQMMSETDAPFAVVYFERKPTEATKTDDVTADDAKTEADAVLSAQELARLVGAPDDAKIETRDLAEFFAASATVKDWMNAEEKATAGRFADLLKILQTELKNVQVLVWGEMEKQVAILGEVEGGVAGLTTLIVET